MRHPFLLLALLAGAASAPAESVMFNPRPEPDPLTPPPRSHPVFMRFFDHPADALLKSAERTRVPADLGTARSIKINATSVLLAGAPGAVATIARRMPRAARAELDEFRLADVYRLITDPRYIAAPAVAR